MMLSSSLSFKAALGFQPLSNQRRTTTITIRSGSLSGGRAAIIITSSSSSSPSPSRLSMMGLYDRPLPPRPPPPPPPRRGPEGEEPEAEDGEDEVGTPQQQVTEQRLFRFDATGREVRDLLPRLKRRLDAGVPESYYEPTDRSVTNLVDKTGVAPVDACWALEACGGDVTEAWICISAARRTLLDASRTVQLLEEDDGYDEQEYEEWMAEQYQAQKDAQKEEDRRRKRREWMKPVDDPDQQWLPMDNPRPVDDEPWFTG
jgi:hypothetical protein